MVETFTKKLKRRKLTPRNDGHIDAAWVNLESQLLEHARTKLRYFDVVETAQFRL